jgi:peptidoglycan/LPS O-acetylase OafA/YrhL
VSVRRNDLDWLRVGAVLLLIPFHSARVFDTLDPFYAKSAQRSALLSWAVIEFLNPWHMPLLFVLVSSERLEGVVHRLWPWLVAGAVLTMAIWLGGSAAGWDDRWADGSPLDVSFSILEYANQWIWVLAVLGLGWRFLNRPHRALRYANEASYPFYLLHQTVIVAVAFVVLGWGLTALGAWALIAISSLLLTLAIYEVAVRRSNITRYLFGMRPLARQPRPHSTPQPTPVG